MQPRAIVVLLFALAACNHSEPTATSTPSPEPAARSADTGAAAPAEPGEHSAEAPQWPGVVTDLTNAKPLYLARVVVPSAILRRKPKEHADTMVPLHKGHVVEVLAEAGPVVTDGQTGESAVWPTRFAGLRGWQRSDTFERLKTPLPDLRTLWDELRKTPAGEGLPDDCPIGGLLADLAPTDGEELVVTGAGPEACEKVLGVFAAGGKLLGWLRTDLIHEIEARPHPGVPGFLDVTTYWVRAAQHTGTGRALYRVPGAPGPLVAAFEATDQAIDARAKPVRYTLSRFAFPPSDAGFYVQKRTTTRVVTGPDEATDETEEHFFRYDGARFVATPAPPGAEPLPREKPGIVTGP